ncbi:MAG: DEAD/DEAH box helicase family protein [Chloroflexi bacterium]|nr:DEAD/DEAH box helicase family protein [Chloroflexota bacterium]
MPRIYVALDLEFTGLNPEHDTILEVGAVRFQGDKVLDTWACLVNPGRAINAKVERLTGITRADIERAPSFHSLIPSLGRFIGENPIVGHTISLDMQFLQHGGMRLANPTLDTFELASILIPYAARYSLAQLARELGIEYNTKHRALEDAQATHKLFIALLERAAQLNPKTIQEIVRVSSKSDWSLRFVWQDIQRDAARQAFGAGSIGAQLKAKGIVEQDENFGTLFSRNKDVRSLKPKTVKTPLDADALTAMLSPDGLFQAQFPGFEYRAEQVEMLQAVANAFNDSGVLLVEAGTGTGKSLAYLLPSISWASQNNERIVISTNTINLQDQLFGKDIPAIQQVLLANSVRNECKFTVLKGRSNYLCLRRFDALRRQDTYTPEEVHVLAKILAWLPSTTTGDMAELTFTPIELKVWARLASDPEHCTTERCANRPDKCYFWRARERAESAHLVVVNHALLLADMALENRVLPEFQYLVIDEAHHLEARATEALAFSATRNSLDALWRQIAGERSGLLANLGAAVRHSRFGDKAREFQRTLDQVGRDAEAAQRLTFNVFDALERFLAQQQDLSGESEASGDKQFRITASRRSQPGWSNIEIEWENAASRFRVVLEGFEKIYRAWQELEGENVAGYADYLQDILFNQRRIRETHSALERAIVKPSQTDIYWASVNRLNGDIGLNAAPLHVGDVLNKNLFAARETVILTSATMSVGGSFTFIENRLGIGDWAEHLQVGSPFDYAQAALLYVPNDIPEPGQQGYQKAIETGLEELLKATRGRALVLFTSHSQLQSTYRALGRKLEEHDVLILAQGLDGSRRQVLDTFKTQERMALFGTKSFWEGVDVVGEALSCLAMARLPFNVPSDPIFSARSETFDDPFAQYAVPEAILRFRQGFGRLIRSKTDRGVVVILDKRVLTKTYGRLFMEALPNCTKQQGPLKELAKRAAAWIDAKMSADGE